MIQQAKNSGALKAPEMKYLPVTGWPKGIFSRLDDDRTPNDALGTAENAQLKQNGTASPRPGLKPYGVQPTGTICGSFYEFVKFSGTTPETWLIANHGGTIKVNKNGGTWSTVTGKTYSTTAKTYFEQIYGKVLITNGTDNLSYMNIDSLTITPFVTLSQPSITSVVATGINGSTYTLRYRITAANQGETAASTASNVGISTVRDLWNGTSQYTTITFPRVSGASRYNIYLGDQAGFEYFLDSVVDPGSGTNVTYVDTGAIATNTNRLAPVGDSTAGPKTTRSTNIKGQVYMVGDTENPERIWFGGTGASALDFSSYNGGGWVEPNKGGKDQPVKVMPFRDGKGTPMAACLSKGTNGAGKRYLLQPTTTTVGDTIISYMQVQEDNGQDGTDSPDGVVLLDDALWYPSRSGFKTTTTRASIQNILSTTGISDNISPDIMTLSAQYMGNCVGVGYDRRIYWALPYASTTNNQIWVLDLRQKGAWMRPWNVSADWLGLYADNSDGKTKFLVLSGNMIYEFDENYSTNDNGAAFQTNIATGSIKFSDDGTMYASVPLVTFTFLRPQGLINLSVTVETEDGPITFTDTLDTTTTEAVAGWGSYGVGIVGWGGIENQLPIAVSANKPRREKDVEIDEEVKSVIAAVNSTTAGVSYEWGGVTIPHITVGRKDNE